MFVNEEKYLKSKVKDDIDLICDNCKRDFTKKKSILAGNYNKGGRKHFCCTECQMNLRTKESNHKLECSYCNNDINIKTSALRNNNFCNSSCAAKYNNARKSTGFRRSKAEVYLEELISKDYPKLKIQTSVRNLIPDGLEIDILLSDLNIAIELNGPVHYFPIYGQTKFEDIQDKDIKKQIYLQQAGYNLIVLNISELKYWKTAQIKIKEMYETKIKPLIN